MKTRLFQILGVVAVTTIGLTSCETDECKDVTCENDGVCVDGTCDCTEGYTGTNCETAWTEAFLGTYDGVDTCGFQYQSVITSTTFNGLTISNAFGLAANATAALTGETTIQVATQTVNGYSISGGSGTLNGDVLTINYTIDGDDCQVAYTLVP